MLVFISVVVVLLLIIYEYLVWNFDYFVKRGVPGSKPTVLFGNVPNMIMQKRHIAYDLHEIYQKFKGQQSFTGIFFARRPQYLLLEPETVKEVMIKHFASFSDNDFDFIDKDNDPIFGRNPFFLKGSEWKEKRAEITPALTMNRIKAAYPLIEDVCSRMVKYIKLQGTDTSVQLKELAAKYTTDVVSNCIFAVDAESFTTDKAVIREMGRKLMEPSLLLNFYFLLTSIIPSVKKVINMRFSPIEVEQFFTKLMHDAFEERKRNPSDRVDFLEYLAQLKEKKNLTNLDTAAHSVTFFADGFETSSIFISGALYELSMNKEVQEKLREEIKETIKTKGGLTFESINEMPYLDQVSHEVLRLYPPASSLAKKCTEDIELNLTKDKKVLIEKGTAMLIPLYSIQRDPEYFPEPDVFNPERFNEEHGGVKFFRDKSVFFPFGDGPRICLGMKFALTQSKAAIAAIVRNFDIHPSEKVQRPILLDPKEFLNMPLGGFWAKFTPIE